MSEVNSKSYERGQVIKIIQSVISKIETSDHTDSKDQIYAQISQLSEVINQLKEDISQSAHSGLNTEEIPNASDHLDEVVVATANATNTIMQSCEDMENIIVDIAPDKQQKIIDEITKIYEACSFQDVTGQRITKVIDTLKKMDVIITDLIHKLDIQVGPFPAVSGSVPEASNQNPETPSKKDLLNGPQLVKDAISQDDIDKLLAEFD